MTAGDRRLVEGSRRHEGAGEIENVFRQPAAEAAASLDGQSVT
jgi:hypothetical protein